jgi:oligopeptide/dipeptide ABC transporter ATP-binding protein
MSHPLIEARDLSVHFGGRGLGARLRGERPVRAVDGVGLSIGSGEVLAIVGESGSGKTTLGRALLGIVPAAGGVVLHDGRDLAKLSRNERRALRARTGIVFQDPWGSLNPRLSVGDQIGEVLRATGMSDRAVRETRIGEVLGAVGLRPAFARRFPHEFSGGQRQRIGIARAIAPRPALLVLDEPVSALDLSVQAQVLNLLAELRTAESMSYLLISHNLDVVAHLADRVAVMYAGKIVEEGPAEAIVSAPHHPYTHALLSATPNLAGTGMRDRTILHGEPPSPSATPAGCRFAPRCPLALALGNPARCTTEVPVLVDGVACHFPNGAADVA